MIEVEQLIDKYLCGLTTLAEEQQLRDFFLQEEIPEHLKQYAPLFGWQKTTKTDDTIMVSAFEDAVAETKEKSLRPYVKWVAAAAIFVVGICVGVSDFFSQPAKAEAFSFAQAIKSTEATKSLVVYLQVRTDNKENFALLDPTQNFTNISLRQLTENGTTYWRIEKERGRTVVFDGNRQYMWLPGKLYFTGTENANFVECFRLLLDPTRLMNAQQTAIDLNTNAEATTVIKDSLAIITSTMKFDNIGLLPIFEGTDYQLQELIMENIFSLKDNLLKAMRVWTVFDGKKVEVVRSSAIKYNVPIDREELTEIPQAEWLDVDSVGTHVVSETRMALLQTELPDKAAQRVMNALFSNHYEDAEEALVYYKEMLNKLSDYQGCKASNFQVQPKQSGYKGVYVTFTLTHPNGKTEHMQLPLRNDNPLHIWIVDGGL